VKQPIYKNSWRWTCKCPKHVEAIYEKNHSKIVCIKLVHLPYLYSSDFMRSRSFMDVFPFLVPTGNRE